MAFSVFMIFLIQKGRKEKEIQTKKSKETCS